MISNAFLVLSSEVLSFSSEDGERFLKVFSKWFKMRTRKHYVRYLL